MVEVASIDANQIEAMSAMLRGIVQALVDDPEAVSVSVITQGGESALRVQVAVSDLGKVVGKQGRTARSLRTILAAASMKLHHRFALEILELPK
ncbi:KH domain-containing protein [soil metagenome]